MKYKDQKKQRKQIVQSLFRWFGVFMFMCVMQRFYNYTIESQK